MHPRWFSRVAVHMIHFCLCVRSHRFQWQCFVPVNAGQFYNSLPVLWNSNGVLKVVRDSCAKPTISISVLTCFVCVSTPKFWAICVALGRLLFTASCRNPARLMNIVFFEIPNDPLIQFHIQSATIRYRKTLFQRLSIVITDLPSNCTLGIYISLNVSDVSGFDPLLTVGDSRINLLITQFCNFALYNLNHYSTYCCYLTNL